MSQLTTTKRRKIFRKATAYEQSVADFHGCQHKGGAGNPDFVCYDGTKGEVKFRKKKMGKKELMKYARKDVTIVESHAGFTKEALEYKNRYRPNMVLCQQGECDDNNSFSLLDTALTIGGGYLLGKFVWNTFKTS